MCRGCSIIKKNIFKGKQNKTSPNYSIMYYKNSNIIGVRRKRGGKEQAFSFGGTKCKLSEEHLRGYADQALENLDAGILEGDVLFAVCEAIKAHTAAAA